MNFKRIFDLVFCLVLLPVAIPITLIVAVLVYIFLGGPVLFTQQRPGFKGKPFQLVKFRTMTNEVDENGVLLSNEVRTPRFSKILRSTSLDELPEIYNVLKGEMSLVGPRPLKMEYLDRYSPEQMRRHDVMPGITGWAQVNGRNAVEWDERFRMDVWYVDNHSFMLDLKILVLTIFSVFKRENIMAKDGKFQTPFKG